MLIKKYIVTVLVTLVSYSAWALACTAYVPAVTNGQRCGAGEVTLQAVSSAGGTTIAVMSMSASPQAAPPGNTTYTPRWYYASSGGTYFATGSLQTFNLSSTTTYYVSTYSSAGCESARVPVTATIIYVTSSSAGPNQTKCSTGPVTLAANTPSSGSGSWSVASGPSTSSGQFSSTSNPSATFTPAGGSGVYTLTWTITNTDCSSASSMSLSVSQAPTTSSAGADQTGSTTCGQTTVTLSANTPSSGSGKWSFANDSPNTNGSFSDQFNPNSTFSGVAGNSYTLAWTITNGSCTSYDDVNVIFNRNPSSSSAGSNQTICQSSTAVLSANTPTVGNGVWSVASGPNTSSGQFSNTSSAGSGFTPSASGIYILAWTISNGVCSPSVSNVTVQVMDAPVANAGSNIIGSETCGQTSVTLAAQTPASGTGSWSIVSGSGGSFGNSAAPTSTFSGTAGTSYTLMWTVSNSPCAAASSNILVKFNRNPTVAIAGADITVCGQTSVTMAAGPIDDGGTGSWSVISGSGGSFSNSTSPISSFTGTLGASYSLRWTISNSPCTPSSDDVNVTFSTPPSQANAGPDQTGATTCGITTVALAATVPANGTGHWSSISGSGGSFSNASNAASDFSGAAGSTYTLRWTVSSGSCATTSDDVVVSFNQLPTIANAGPQQTGPSTCGQTSVSLAANTPVSGTGMWSIAVDAPVPPGYSFANKFDPNTVFTGTPGIVYNLVWTISNGTCSSSSETIVKFGQQPTDAYAGIDQVLCPGTASAILNANTPSAGTGMWSVTSGPSIATSQFGNVTSPSTTFTPSGTSGSYVLTWSISVSGSGCPASTSSVTINAVSIVVPVATGQLVLANDNAPFLQVIVPEGTQAQWYTDNKPSTLPFSNATSYQATSINETFYFVSLKSLTTGCESPRQRIFRTQGNASNLSKIIQDVVRVQGVVSGEEVTQLTSSQRTRSISYTDGFGRPLQSIAINTAPGGMDMVLPYEYDANGRSAKSYLPYAHATSENFQEMYQGDVHSFYTATGDKIADDEYPFAMTRYEQSPLGRPLEAGGVGQKWQLGSHSKNITYSYNTGSTNSEGEEVRKLSSNGTSFNSFYSANTLSRTVVTNENGHTNIIFRDASGKTIVRKQQLDGTIKNTAVAYLQTYYLYNEMQQLQYIIPPGGVAALQSNGWAMSTMITDQYFHQFLYDNRGRLVQKKTPGQAWTYYVYDKFNRVVLTQDANQRTQNLWMFVKYDRMGRSVMSGLYKNTTQTNREDMQTLVGGLYATGAYYENPGTALHGYTNQSFPTVNSDTSPLTIYSVAYFDDYDFDNNGTADFAYDNTHLAGLPVTTGQFIRGQATGSKRLILDTNDWLMAAVFYDNYGRSIQVQGNNHLNLTGLDKSSTVFDFEGKVVSSKATHANATVATNILQTPVYDAQGRTTHVKHQIDSQPEQIVAQYQYNKLGQVVMKQLHKKADGNFLQNVDYRFDIRGAPTSINNAQLASDGGETNGDTDDCFGIELLYDKQETGLGNTAYYNGVVSAVKWKNAGDEAGTNSGQRSYVYGYDKTNQLTTANFKKYGSAWNEEMNTLNESQTYDHNGNILSLVRSQSLHSISGTSITSTPQTIDDLAYTYTTGNQLGKVTDASVNGSGFNDGANQTAEYSYDVHGNLTQDLNKGISAITYNVSGKAQQISFTDGRTVSYTYDASGNKLRMTTLVNSVTTITDYANAFTYTNGVLSFFPSPEGRVVKNGNDFEYQYAIADHQGNTRVVFSSEAPPAEVKTATFEGDSGDDVDEYLNVNASYVVPFVAANHTVGGLGAVRMNQNYPVGPSKSIKVYPGDALNAEVWAYYESSSGYGNTNTGLAAMISSVTSVFTGGLTGGEATLIGSSINDALVAFGLAGNQGDDVPAAYLNYMLFDKNHKLLDMGWKPVTEASNWARAKVEFEQSVKIKEEGYLYVYLSYENQSNNFVYFDDFKVTHTRTNIVQSSEYYPFGMQTQNSWTREKEKENSFLYNQGSELNATTGLYDLPFRNYDASLGRFFQVDPLSHADNTLTPYHYAGNSPINSNDPTGLMRPMETWEDVRRQNTLHNLNPYMSFTPDWYNDGGFSGSSNWSDSYGSNYDGGDPFGDALKVSSGKMSREEYIAKYSRSDYRLVYNENEAADGAISKDWSIYTDRSYWDDQGALFSSKGEALAFAVYKNGYGAEYWGWNKKSDPSLTDVLLAGVGTAGLVAERQSEIVSSSRSGFTSGKLSGNSPKLYSKVRAGKIAIAAKGVGWGLTFWSVYNTEAQFRSGEIDASRRQYNHINNGVGVAFPLTAIPVAVGDYLGQRYSNEIVYSVSEPNGFLFETMKSTLEFFGLQTGPSIK